MPGLRNRLSLVVQCILLTPKIGDRSARCDDIDGFDLRPPGGAIREVMKCSPAHSADHALHCLRFSAPLSTHYERKHA